MIYVIYNKKTYENKKELSLKGLNQMLAQANDVDLLGDSEKDIYYRNRNETGLDV